MLIDDLLRKQWGFEGYVVSDCDAIHDIWGRQQHHFVNTPEEAAKLEPKVKRTLEIAKYLPDLEDGMAGAVEYGTAQRARVPGLVVAGKTGSVRAE